MQPSPRLALRWGSCFKVKSEEISQAIYYAQAYQAKPPPHVVGRVNRIRIAEHFGWTMDYVDDLIANDPFTMADIQGVMDADAKLAKRKN